jgi:peptidoglycan hydrolase-like protein with peptidoglycan-binding domain
MHKGVAVDTPPFFPEFLNHGSRGPAVILLQLLLKAGGYNRTGIIPDGDYGEETAKGVRLVQGELGFAEEGIDGNFGPKTRAAYRVRFGIDVNAIPIDAFTGETKAVGPPIM